MDSEAHLWIPKRWSTGHESKRALSNSGESEKQSVVAEMVAALDGHADEIFARKTLID